MRAGRTFVSASPAGPQLYLDRVGDRLEVEVRGGQGNALVLIGDRGVVDTAAVASDQRTMTFGVPPGSYVRAQLVGSTGDVMALTSPIWLA
jgi:hypothetical protein